MSEIMGMSRILEIDGEVMTVEAGIVVDLIEIELNRRCFTPGHMPGSRPTVTIGDVINSSGQGGLVDEVWYNERYGTSIRDSGALRRSYKNRQQLLEIEIR